jgi:hypothetical protein
VQNFSTEINPKNPLFSKAQETGFSPLKVMASPFFDRKFFSKSKKRDSTFLKRPKRGKKVEKLRSHKISEATYFIARSDWTDR